MDLNRKAKAQIIALFLTMASCLSGCSGGVEISLKDLDIKVEEPVTPETARPPHTTVLFPETPGEVVMGNKFASIDASRTQEGYIQVCYSGKAAKAKVQITIPDGTVYTYTLKPGGYETLPLTGGSGSYGITVMEHAYDNIYAMAYSGQVKAETVEEFKPYLYPNQYIWYTPDSPVYALGVELTGKSRDDLDYVETVYEYVVENILYDHELAASMPVDYIPSLEQTMITKKGICLDYAALMTALLRSQGIPTKLVVGYSGQVYHAWISVFLEETGWVDSVIYFDGTNWSRMDPTLAAGNRGTSVKDYVNNNENYQDKYFY